MRRGAILGVCAVLLVALATTAAADERCKGNPDIVGACYRVHGRLDVWNGAPTFRIWIIGTHHVLGVDPLEDGIMPTFLLEQLQAGYSLTGSYMVCPFRRERRGYMGSVCIESATRLAAEDRQSRKLPTRFFPGPYSLSSTRKGERALDSQILTLGEGIRPLIPVNSLFLMVI